MESPASTSARIDTRRHLLYKTSHAPSLADLVGYDQVGSILDFCFTANPYYPTEGMLKNIREHLPTLIKSYPSCDPGISRRHLAAVLHVKADRLLIGNGATELIAVICRSIVRTLGLAVPAFGEYLHGLKSSRAARLYHLNAKRDYHLNLASYLAWARSRRLRAILVANPANPTGQFHPIEQLREFLTSAQDMDLVVVDESFIDFAGDPIPTLIAHADEFPNLLVVRSMSKHCGVAGLRIGYCYSSNEKLLEQLRRALSTWSVSTIAEFFLALLPDTTAEYHDARRRITDDVGALLTGLSRIPGIWAYPTAANFALVRIDGKMTATELVDRLLQDHKMYVRDCSNKVGMDNYHIRISTQGRQKDALLLAALEQIFGGAR